MYPKRLEANTQAVSVWASKIKERKLTGHLHHPSIQLILDRDRLSVESKELVCR